MFTDPARVKRTDPGHPDKCNVHSYYEVFAPERAKDVALACREAKVGCTECKKELAEILVKFLAPIQEKRNQFLKDKAEVLAILAEGKEKAACIAEETMQEVKTLVNLTDGL